MKKTGWQDIPVASVTDDLFNVSTYVNGLCSFIRSCDTPMTISIQGDWGSGKTSMMNMIKENLQGTIYPIWFNTWQFSQFDMGGALVFSMMEVLLDGLGCNAELRQKILNGLLGFGKTAIKAVTEKATTGVVAEKVGDMLDGGGANYASEILKLKDRFQNAVNEKLKKEHKDRVVIFVDDLDRLQPVKAVELLEVLKLFLDCENCIFILAVDYEVVTLGIKQKFGSDVDDEKGRSFFDKIIQLPFKMPVAQYDIKKYVTGMMEHLSVSTDAKEVTLFYNLIRTSAGFNPRSIKRLFNTYELLDIITKSTVQGISDAVRKRVLFAIVCTQMCFEKLYLYLTSTKIEEDTFTALHDTRTCSDVLREIYTGLVQKELDEQVKKVSAFIPYFIDAMQVDDDETLSKEELENLRTILKCSVVTSVKAMESEGDDSSKEWEYREINKDIVRTTAEKLENVGKFAVWMPRKAANGVKISDISGYYVWATQAGFSCRLEYYLSRIDEYTTGVHIYITEPSYNKGPGKLFLTALGENPLKFRMAPITDENSYKYLNVLRLNNNDANAPDQIASVVRNAYDILLSAVPGDG